MATSHQWNQPIRELQISYDTDCADTTGNTSYKGLWLHRKPRVNKCGTCVLVCICVCTVCVCNVPWEVQQQQSQQQTKSWMTSAGDSVCVCVCVCGTQWMNVDYMYRYK